MNKSSNSFSCMLVASAISHIGLGILFYGTLLYGEQDVNRIGSYIVSVLFFSGLSLFGGFFISILYGIPAYHFLENIGFSNYASAAFLGVLPGIILIVSYSAPINKGVLIFGFATAIIYHRLKISKSFT